MANYVLNVPIVHQTTPYSCWYAAACMVAYYRVAGPRLGVPAAYAKSDKIGLEYEYWPEFAKNEGLKPLPNPNRVWTASDLETTLRTYGPLWTWGMWFGFSHIITVIGVIGDNVVYNDPDAGNPSPGYGSMKWFNEKLIAYKDPIQYQPA